MLKKGINRLLEEINNIRAVFPFTLEKQLNDDSWVEEQRSVLKKDIEAVTERNLHYRTSISLILQTLDL